jgi:threonine-phosphate decarboxylase
MQLNTNIFHGGYTGQGKVIDFSANINPLAPPEFIESLLNECTRSIYKYPDWTYKKLREAISDLYGVPAELVYPSNGASHGIVTVLNTLKPRTVILPIPTYGDYEAYAEALNVTLKRIPFIEDGNEYKIDLKSIIREASHARVPGLVPVTTPNNPTGTLVSYDEIEFLRDSIPEGFTLLVDESYITLALGRPARPIGGKPGIVSVRSLTKELGVPGLRIGFALAEEEIAEKLWAVGGAWQVNSLSECILRRIWESYRDDYAKFLSDSHRFINNERARLTMKRLNSSRNPSSTSSSPAAGALTSIWLS